MDERNPRTVAYPEQPSGDSRPPVRVAFGRGGSGDTDDLYRLLRRRLLAVMVIGLLFWGLSAVSSVWVLWRGSLAGGLDQPGFLGPILSGSARLGSYLAVVGGAAWVLWRRPPASVAGLRVIELLVLAVVVALQLTYVVRDDTYGFLARLPDDPAETRPALLAGYNYSQTLGWFTLITVYGAVVPNTLRRCLAVAGGLAVCPLALFAVYAFWLDPLPWPVATDFLFSCGQYLGIAVAAAAFSSSRVERFRRQALAARKLGQYVLKEQLGAGGMGEVYRAEHVLLRRPCALKLIRPERAGDPGTLQRFEREVQVTATLTHPNTIQVFDYGHAADGTFYYVMEYLPGLTLEELVRRHGPLPPGRAVHLLRQVCAALGEAHARGLTHRDVKPGNVMVCERGGAYDVAKVLDFGLVRVPQEDADGTLTRAGTVAGTPAYMSPEQVGGEGGVDPRSDLYSVGALAYFLLTGRPPFAGRSAPKVLAAHLYETPAALPAGVPPDLAGVVLRGLAKSPDERWPDAASLRAALGATATPEWTADDAAAWWGRDGRAGTRTGQELATATWADPGAAPDRGRT